ncbi:2-amino-4-hydroxy-6-hydroxymethyldihydropteridine diphosphokinase [Consotaella aegiceratis]|uniref:2-amino-4-hydroxy-6- hydroxymethyldihydropteridine diphosphokinase n=1 Tax=Consotaella aegiceratis TaxID=3097961 RepID=UPI002F42FFD1
MMVRTYLGLGGNIGDPAASMGAALRLLDVRDDTSVLAVSRLYRTPPWGKLDQPDFLNACARVETTLAPRDLLDVCLATERTLKRERIERWGPRTVDIDILDYDGRRIEETPLTLPHPRMTERAFVLVPLAEIAADLVIGGRSVADWLRDMDAAGIEPAGGSCDWWRE